MRIVPVCDKRIVHILQKIRRGDDILLKDDAAVVTVEDPIDGVADVAQRSEIFLPLNHKDISEAGDCVKIIPDLPNHGGMFGMSGGIAEHKQGRLRGTRVVLQRIDRRPQCIRSGIDRNGSVRSFAHI